MVSRYHVQNKTFMNKIICSNINTQANINVFAKKNIVKLISLVDNTQFINQK